jgi:hypothetical protein
MTHKNRKKSRIFMFLSTGCSLLRAKGFSSTSRHKNSVLFSIFVGHFALMDPDPQFECGSGSGSSNSN